MTDDRAAGVVSRHHRLAPVPESARAARDAVVDVLDVVGRRDLADAASLLVSELVTNAIVHARTSIELDVRAGAGGLRVAVSDGSQALPTQRHYGRSATTGRGLGLLEMMSDRYGTDLDDGFGKTVWFELGSAVSAATVLPAPLRRGPEVTEVLVTLVHLPVALALAWQQHADTLLREYTLSRWDEDSGVPPAPVDDGAAHDAFAAFAAAMESLAGATSRPQYADVLLRLPPVRVGQFRDLEILLEHVLHLAELGMTLAPTTQPEARSFRHWVVTEVFAQAAGAPPTPWVGLPDDLEAAAVAPVAWDSSAVTVAAEAMVAADDLNRIIAASPAAMELLGWDSSLVGRRIVTIIPARYRETHIAAFTLTLLTGEGTILGQEVVVPALRRDGSEIDVSLLVRRETVVDGRSVFTATLRPA